MNSPAFVDSCQNLKLFLITRATTAKSFVDPGAAGSNDVRQFRAFSLALLMGLS
jgi:hypothetical protein